MDRGGEARRVRQVMFDSWTLMVVFVVSCCYVAVYVVRQLSR